MPVRRKTLLIFGVALIMLSAAIYFISESILLDGFLKLEDQQLLRNLDRSKEALSSEIAHLNDKTSDWAVWDDTYNFILDTNPAYIKSNINNTTFTGLNINLMLFINSRGQIVFAKGFDLENKKDLPLPESLLKQLKKDSPLLRHTKTEDELNGIIMVDDLPLLVCSRPILTSEGRGPIRGTLIFGRYLDGLITEQLARIVGLPLSINSFSDKNPPADFRYARNNLFKGKPVFKYNLDRQTAAGYALIEDIYGRPAFILSLSMPRDIFKQGQTVAFYFFFTIAAVGLTLMAIIIFLLDKLILSRLEALGTSVKGIARSGGFSLRLSVSGGDEISVLSNEINQMLEGLEGARDKLEESEQRYRSLVENVNSIVLKMDAQCRVTFWNRFAVEFFGYSETEILGHSVIGTIVPETETSGRNLKELVLNICSNPGEYANSINENKKKNGQRVWIAWANRPILDKHGNLAGVMCVGNDITESKKLETRLVALNKAFLNLGADFDKNISLLTSTCGELLEASCALYSKLSEGLLNTLCHWHTPEGYNPVYKPDGHICYDLIKANRKEVYLVRNLDRTNYFKTDPNVANYGLKTYAGYPIYSFGECVGSLCVVYQQDVIFGPDDKMILEIMATAISIEEERRFSEDALRKSRDFYLTLFDKLPTPIWRTGIDAKSDYFNKAWLNFTGKGIEQEIGFGWKEGVHPEDAENCLNTYLEAFNKRQPFEMEFRLRRYDGQYRRVVSSGTPFYDAKGNFTGYIGSCYDITERK